MTIARTIPDLYKDKSKRKLELIEELAKLDEDLNTLSDIEQGIDEQCANLVEDLNEQIEDLFYRKILEVRDNIDDTFDLFDIDSSNLNSLLVASDKVSYFAEYKEKP